MSETNNNRNNNSLNNNNNANSSNNNNKSNGNRNYNRNSKSNNNKNNNNRHRGNKNQNKKTGDIEELGNHVLNCASGASETHERTSRKLADYIGREHGGDMRYVVENHKKKTMPKPEQVDSPTEADELIFKAKCSNYVKRELKMDENSDKAYSIVWGQCAPSMKAKLRAIQDYETMKDDLDTAKLMKEIKLISCNFQEKNYAAASIHNALEKFIACKQAEDMSDQRHLDKCNDSIKVMNNAGIILNVSELIAKQEHGDASMKTEDEMKVLIEEAQNKFLGYGCLKGLCRERYGDLKTELHNDFNKGNDNYPQNAQEAYDLQVNHWKRRGSFKNNNSNRSNVSGGVSFDNASSNNKHNKHKDLTCCKCGKKGHIKPNCPENENNNENNGRSNNNNRGHSDHQNNNNQNDNNDNNDNDSNNNDDNENASQHFQMRSLGFLTRHKDAESTGVQQAYLNNNRFLKEEYNNYKCKFANS